MPPGFISTSAKHPNRFVLRPNKLFDREYNRSVPRPIVFEYLSDQGIALQITGDSMGENLVPQAIGMGIGRTDANILDLIG